MLLLLQHVSAISNNRHKGYLRIVKVKELAYVYDLPEDGCYY